MKTNYLAIPLGLIFLLTGIFAFFQPQQFFDSIGNYYGLFNYHFVKDAGLAFSSSGFLLLLSVRMPEWKVPLTLGGAMFVVLHGLFHVQMLVMGMVPTAGDVVKELAMIVTPAILTVVLFVMCYREDRPE